MTVIAIIFVFLMMALLFGGIIWLVILFDRYYRKWILHQNLPNKKTGTRVQKRTNTTSKALMNNDHLASKMVRQQNRSNQRQRNRSVAPKNEDRGVQYAPGGPLYHTKHYRMSHFTDNIVNEPHSYRRNNKTYGKDIQDRYRNKQNQRDQERTAQRKGNQGKQRSQKSSQQKQQAPTRRMLDAIADSYAQNMEYSAGFQQAVKRSKKD